MENRYCVIMGGGIGSRFGLLAETTDPSNSSIFSG